MRGLGDNKKLKTMLRQTIYIFDWYLGIKSALPPENSLPDFFYLLQAVFFYRFRQAMPMVDIIYILLFSYFV